MHFALLCYDEDMKTLFVCRANVGRSQAAMELYNLHHPGEAESAGTMVETPGQLLRDRVGANVIIDVMKTYGVDISQNVRRQLTPEMLKNYDKVIVLAEPESIPDWLRGDNVKLWPTPDTKGEPFDVTQKIVAGIEARVAQL